MTQEYYQGQIDKLKDFTIISVKFYDYDGNETFNFSVNKESIPVIRKLLTKILKMEVS